VLDDIAIPTLLINAQDDPFLTENCHPVDLARESSVFTLDLPAHGSHVGFVDLHHSGEYWHETRICDFLEAHT
jgi:predicted alpha/beta-fold hydrolase